MEKRIETYATRHVSASVTRRDKDVGTDAESQSIID